MRYVFNRVEFNKGFQTLEPDLMIMLGIMDSRTSAFRDNAFEAIDKCLKYVEPALLDYYRMMGLTYTPGGEEISFDDDTLIAMKCMSDLLWCEDQRVIELADGTLQSMCVHPLSMCVRFNVCAEEDLDLSVGAVLMFVDAAVQFFNITEKM